MSAEATPPDVVVDPAWRERVLRRVRQGPDGKSCARRNLIVDLAVDYVAGHDDVPMIGVYHDCNCEFCVEDPEGEDVDWDDPQVQTWLDEGRAWARQAIRELVYLGVLKESGTFVVLVTPDPEAANAKP